MASLSITRAWEETRARLAQDGKLYFSVALALILLPQAIAGMAAPPVALSGVRPEGWASLLVLVAALLGITGQISIATLALGGPTSVGEAIQRGLGRLAWTFVALLLFGLAVGLVLIPLVMLVAGPEQIQAAAAGQVGGRAGGAVLLAGIVAVALGVRFQMIVPAAAAEEGGPFHLLKRSWSLTAGNYWRLLAFILLLLVATGIIVVAAQIVGGIVARLFFGSFDPFSAGALVFSLIVAAAQAAFSMVVSVMLARIYVQLAAGGASVSVPSSAD